MSTVLGTNIILEGIEVGIKLQLTPNIMLGFVDDCEDLED